MFANLQHMRDLAILFDMPSHPTNVAPLSENFKKANVTQPVRLRTPYMQPDPTHDRSRGIHAVTLSRFTKEDLTAVPAVFLSSTPPGPGGLGPRIRRVRLTLLLRALPRGHGLALCVLVAAQAVVSVTVYKCVIARAVVSVTITAQAVLGVTLRRRQGWVRVPGVAAVRSQGCAGGPRGRVHL